MSENHDINLDPENWETFSSEAHIMLDDMINHLKEQRTKKVWNCMSDDIRNSLMAPSPTHRDDMSNVYNCFKESILDYGSGNIHPGFMGWVQGGGSADRKSVV